MPAPQTTLTPLQLVTPVLPQNTTTVSVDSSVLPVAVLADTNTVRVEVSLYNSTIPLTTFTTTNGQNEFSGSFGLVPTVQETTVQLLGRNYDPNAIWQPITNYAAGYRYADSNGNVQVVVQSGITGVTIPTWKTLAPATITNVQLATNTLTIVANNSFSPGDLVYLTGLSNATFLNGLVVIIVTANGTSFTAALNHVDYVGAADTGNADICTSDATTIWANFGAVALTPTVKFTLLFFQSNLAIVIAPPSGILAKKNQTNCTLQWVTPDYPGFIGVRVMISTDQAGINPPYVQFGDLVTAVSSTSPTVITSNSNTAVNVPTASITNISILNNVLTVTAVNTFSPSTVVELSDIGSASFLNGQEVTLTAATPTSFQASFTHADYSSTPDNGQAVSIISTQTTITTEVVQTTNFSSVNIPYSLINANTFYALLSTVIQDPSTNAVYESVQNGPLLSGFVNLKVVNPTDFPQLQRKEDIAGRLINQIIRQRPNLDLSPRSEIRDVFVDPFSIEVANMSIRDWFARVATSISAISQVDDTTGTGVSDPFQSSPYKQQIARAYGLSPQDTQTLIDEQFDINGEQAGLSRGLATSSTVVLTFYTFQQPQSSLTIPQGAIVATVGDSTTPALNFVTQGSATINVNNLTSFFNTQTGWWGVSVPAQCAQTGSIGNVGAGSIRQVVSGIPTGLNVTNLVGATFGTDEESNSAFAARIQARTVTGVDSGTRHGYLVTALSTPGIIDAEVVAAGDIDMLRDWDAIRQKHVFGTVDIYTRGTTLSEQDEDVDFTYQNTGVYGSTNTYLTLTQFGPLKFTITNFNQLAYPLYDAVELLVFRTAGGASFYLSTDRAQFDNANGVVILNALDSAYQYVGSTITRAKKPLLLNNVPATNQQALASLTGATPGTYQFLLYARLKSPFIHAPALQPVLEVFSVTGQANQTGAVNPDLISLIHTSDFLLNGGSNNAGDQVQVAIQSSATQKTITALTATPVTIDVAMDMPLDANGNPVNALSVRSTDLSTLYQVGVDYSIVATGPYHQYGLQVLTSSVTLTAVQITSNVLTVQVVNDFGVGASVLLGGLTGATFLNGQAVTIATVTPTQFTATFTHSNYAQAPDTGTVTGNAIQNNQEIVVAYNKFGLYERVTFVSQEAQVLNGTLPTTLNNDGFVRNTWMPESYTLGIPTLPLGGANAIFYSLTLDGWNGLYGGDGGLDIPGSQTFDPSGLVGNSIPHDNRYIKVTYFDGVQDLVKKENIDFTLSVDSVSGTATVSRIVTGTIPDGGTVKISYFYAEPFTFATQFPAFVEILANQIAFTKHAAADVLVKAMVASPVDITMAVTLQNNASPEAVDPVIRTVTNIVLDNATGTLFQSELVRQVQAITGVKSVQLPLIKCAKSDASYDIGVVIPTGTTWIPLASDPAFAGQTVPANSWISASPVLPDMTIPSGGEATAIVDFLYQGQVFKRAFSVQDFLTTSTAAANLASLATPGSFYIIGLNDEISSTLALPAGYQQKVILQVPLDVVNPGNLSYLCTYQVFNETGAKDVSVSSTEYLAPGRITVNYVTGS